MKAERSTLLKTLESMKSEGYDYLTKVTAVDYLDHIDVIYFIRNIKASEDDTLEITLKPGDLWLPSVMQVHMSADWYERELSEMFGIEIKGRHAPRLFLEKWDGIDPPLRKGFIWDKPYRTKEDKW